MMTPLIPAAAVDQEQAVEYFPTVTQHLRDTKRWRGASKASRPKMMVKRLEREEGGIQTGFSIFCHVDKLFCLATVLLMSLTRISQEDDCFCQDPGILVKDKISKS